MKGKSKFIITIVTVIIVAVIAIICGGQRALVTASSTANVPGPSQFYLQHNLISDGFVPADITHSNTVYAWGLVSGPTTPWWIANNGTGTTTLYNVGTGTIVAHFTVPGAGGEQGNPTGLVFNGGTAFVVNNGVGAPAPARFIFASEDGKLSGFQGCADCYGGSKCTGASAWCDL